MSSHELRAEARIPVTQRGRLSTGTEEWFPCMVLDMSNSGFLMVCTRKLPVGQILDFRCEIYPGKFVDCKIEVMHSEQDSIGTMITEIDEKSILLFQSYLEEKYAQRLDNPKKEPL